jgi:pyruvate dehydrogenase E1 component alpha subunit
MESLNWAKVYGLPVLFVCEDNGYAATTRNDSVTAGAGAGARAESVGITSTPIDGNDVLAVDEAARALIAAIRGGGGPRFLHARTYRQKGHTAADKAGYRDAAAHERGMGTCPIARSAELLATNGVARTRLDQIRAEAEAEMAAAVARVREQPFAPMSAAFEDVQDVGAPAMEEPWWRR